MEVFAVVLVALVLLALFVTAVALYAWRFQKVGPNEVLVISGRRDRYIEAATGEEKARNYRIVQGGGTFVWPVVERVDDLSLEIMTIDVVTPKVYTSKGVPLTVDGVAQVKIRGDDVSISTAAEQFLSKTVQEIKNVALQTMEGHLRAILGTLTVEEIYQDRDAFAQQVQAVAAGDMANMGLQIVSFTIRDIRDDQGYLDALGQARTAEVKRDARIGEANADRDARIQAAKAMQAAREAEFLAETRVAEAEKQFAVQKASYDAEVNRRRAEAEQAYNIQTAIEQQKVRAEEVQVEVVEREKSIEVQRQEALRREQELEATVRKPAEAERYRLETIANGARYQREAEAQAEATAIKVRGEAEAQASQVRGLADAQVIQAKGEAEAAAMREKAASWATYNQAAILDRLLSELPAIANAVSQPLAKTDKIVVIGGGDAGTGINRITQDITSIIAQMPAAVEALTGIDVIGSIRNLDAVRSADGQAGKETIEA
ncbi:MAG: flotillin family protein [Ardenticatenaceae bacterium]